MLKTPFFVEREYKAQFNTQRSIVELSMFVFREYLLADCGFKLYSQKQFVIDYMIHNHFTFFAWNCFWRYDDPWCSTDYRSMM